MIHWIRQPDDERLEAYRHLGDPDWLRTQALFVAEGRLVVARLIALERYEIVSILVNRAAHDALIEPLSSVDTEVYVCDDETLAGITGFNFHRGCLALVARPAPTPAERLLEASRLLALEGVGNPDNVGGLFRTAAAFNVEGILLSATSGDPLYRKAIRTSMGAVLRLPFARLENWLEGLERFRQNGFRIIALTPNPDAPPLALFARELDGWDRMILLVGSEGLGLETATLAHADARVRIPIDPTVDSLNVVVAAGIALERLGGSQINSQLPTSNSQSDRFEQEPRQHLQVTVFHISHST
jgi:tRNA G18 (ribose-2'-O)-methylase SpoU